MWKEFITNRQQRILVIIPIFIFLGIAVIMRVFWQTYFWNTNIALNEIFVIVWFFMSVLVPSLQLLYEEKQFPKAVVIFILTIIVSILIINTNEANSGDSLAMPIAFVSTAGYLIGVIIMLTTVKPELDYHKITQLSRSELIILLAPVLSSLVIFCFMIFTNSFEFSPLLMIVSAVIVGSYAIISGWWSRLPVSTIVITSLSICFVFIIDLIFSQANSIGLLLLLIEFAVLTLATYFGKRNSYRFKKS